MSEYVEALRKALFDKEEGNRRSGRSTRIAKRVKATGATMVCYGVSEKAWAERQFGVKAMTLESYLSPDFHRGAGPKMYLFDHFAEYQMVNDQLKVIGELIDAGEKSVSRFNCFLDVYKSQTY